MATLPELSPETEKLQKELETWANQKRGKRAELVPMLGVDCCSLTDWLKRKSEPSWETGHTTEVFLKAERRPESLGPRRLIDQVVH